MPGGHDLPAGPKHRPGDWSNFQFAERRMLTLDEINFDERGGHSL
jgi:hypothetical protein